MSNARVIQVGDQCRTRQGHSVRIVCVDVVGGRPVLGLVMTAFGEEPVRWNCDGSFAAACWRDRMDLVLLPEATSDE